MINRDEAINPGPVGTTTSSTPSSPLDSPAHRPQNPIREMFSRPSSFFSHPIVRDNLPIIAIVAAYVIALYAVYAIFGIHNKLILTFYYYEFARLSLFCSCVLFLFHVLKGSYKRYLTSRSIAGFLTIFILTPIFNSAFVSHKQIIPLINAFRWDAALMRLDYVLHFGHHPWRLLEPILSHPMLVRALDLLYMSWFVFLFLSCLWMAWSRRRRLRLCFFISVLLIWILLGSGMSTIFSSAGPCYYSRVVQTADNPYTPLMKKLNEIHKILPLDALDNQAGLWAASRQGIWFRFGGISAMPSIHLAIATAFALLAFNVRKWLGAVFAVILALTQIASVILGWHYAIDGYAGILFAVLIWFTIARVLKRSAHAFP
jgi:hypothetical protein